MDSRIGGARWPLCPLVIVLSSFPSYFFSSASPRAASRRSLKLRFSVRGLRFTAFRENRSPQAKIAGCARLRDFFPTGSEHAGKCECTRRFFPVQGKIEGVSDGVREFASRAP